MTQNEISYYPCAAEGISDIMSVGGEKYAAVYHIITRLCEGMTAMIRKTAAALLALILLAGCSNINSAVSDDKVTAQLFAMDTLMEITAYGGDEELLSAAMGRIYELEALLSVTDENSEVYALNHNQGRSLELSRDTAALIEAAIEFGDWTQGALDITVYPAVKAWGFTTGEYTVPSGAELEALLEHVDYRLIEYDSVGRTARLPDEVEIDLGSIAKGYAGDEIAALLISAGVTSAIINLGGNVQAVGAKPDGSPWKIAIKSPLGSGYLGVVEVNNKAVITSGGYERCFEDENGNIYWHIIDPATGRPADKGLISVTIIGDSGITCDALSTALFVLGLEEAAEYWREYGGFEAVFMAESGKVHITEGLQDSFSPLDDYEGAPLEVIKR